jgi:hypothetical protein
MLTARQMVSIATQSSVPPLHLSGLAKMYTVSPFSLRAIGNLMQQQKTFFVCEVRDLSLLTAASPVFQPPRAPNSYQELQAVWAASGQPSTASLQQLGKMLPASGCTYLSEYWHEVGIAGNPGTLAGLNVYRLDVLAGFTVPAAESARALDGSPPPPPPPPSPIGDGWSLVQKGLAGVAGTLIAYGNYGPRIADEALIAALTGAEISQYTWALAVGISLGGVLAAATLGVGVGLLGVGIYELLVNNSTVTPSVSPPDGGYTNLPVDATNADAGVLSITTAVNPYAGYSSAPVDLNSLPSSPPPTPAPPPPGGTPAPTPAPGGKDDKEASDKMGKDGGKEAKDGKEGKDGKESSDKGSSDKSKESSDKGKESSDKGKEKESSDKGKESKDGSDLAAPDGEFSPREVVIWMKSDVAENAALTPVMQGRSKPARLLTRTPVV